LSVRGAGDFSSQVVEFEKGEGILHQVISEGKPRILKAGRFSPAPSPEACSVLGVPLRVEEGTVGAIVLERGLCEPFAESDLEILDMLASQAAQAIRNAQNYERLERQYEELRRTQQELLKQERLALLGEMAAIVAHEIRNPLTSVKGFAQRIKRKSPDQETVGRYAEIIMEEVDRLDAVIGDVLDFARRAAPKWQEVDLGEVIRQTIDLLGAGLERPQVVLSVETAPDLPRLKGDPAQLKQVLLNICQNALQAMPEGGALGIETTCKEGAIRVSIHDTGRGIPPEVRSKIFHPFFTTRTHGTGLGLALAQHIVEDHGGRITLESEVGQGTTFTIELPVGFEPA